MKRQWNRLIPLILLAACSPAGNSQAAQPAPASNPQQVAGAPPPAAVTIPSGTALRVRLDQAIDTRRNRPGDTVRATLAEPVVAGGSTVLPVGTRFTGHVTEAGASRRLKGRAHIGITLDSFQWKGRQYRVATTAVDRASAAHKKRNAVLIGGGAGLGTALGAVAGGPAGAILGAGAGAAAGTAGAAVTGKRNVAIPAETLLRFTLRAPVEL